MSKLATLKKLASTTQQMLKAKQRYKELQRKRDQLMVDARFSEATLSEIGEAAEMSRQGASKVLRVHHHKEFGRGLED